MTPFGLKLSQLRREAHLSQKEAAIKLGVSAAYLSALEHGRKGTPSFVFIQRVITLFNIIWDDADDLMRLAQLSRPKLVIDTRNLKEAASRFVYDLADNIHHLNDQDIAALASLLSNLLDKKKK